MSADKREQIRNKIKEAAELMRDQQTWMRNTIILKDGTHLGIGEVEPDMSDELNAAINEVFELVGDDDDLRSYMLKNMDEWSGVYDYRQRREEALGWKPGMVVGTPDIPQEKVDEYIGVTFHCPNCGDEE